jgi:hypothetical protein
MLVGWSEAKLSRSTLARRGTSKQTELAHEFGIHEYPYPRLLGEDREKWARVAKLIDDAARNDHRRTCSGIAADGRTRLRPERFVGDHADQHRWYVRLALVALLDAGIPQFLASRD